MHYDPIEQLGLHAAVGVSPRFWESWVQAVRSRPSRHRELFHSDPRVQDKQWDITGERAWEYWRSLQLIADANAEARNALSLHPAGVDPSRLLYFDPRRMTYEELLANEFGIFDSDEILHPEFVVHVDPPSNARTCIIDEERGWVLAYIPERLGVDMQSVMNGCATGWLWLHGEGPGQLMGV